MPGKRRGLSKKLRFEVFKRDSFRCQYCGGAAPDVLLRVDHIKPVKDGGTNQITNLITACEDCNQGKGARTLDDQSALSKQRRQLEALNERREQLKMMMEWHEELLKLDEEKVEFIAKRFEERTGHYLTITGQQIIRKLIRSNPIERVIASLEDSANQYLRVGTDGKAYTPESVSKTFDYISRICRMKALYEAKPHLQELYYIRAILNKKLNYCDLPEAIRLLEAAYDAGCSLAVLKKMAVYARNWTSWASEMEEYIEAGGDA